MTTAAKGDPRRLALGLGLVLLGLLWLLGAFHLLPVWRLAMLAVAAGFLGLAAVCGLAYRRDPATRYGFLVPAGVLVSLSLSVLLESLFRRVPDPLHALVFFAGPALAFARIYTLDRRRGWALISASLCGVLGATASLGELRVFHGDLGGAIFLAGTGAIFFWHFLRTGRDWAVLPAGFLASSALMILVDDMRFLERVAPALFLLCLAATFALYDLVARPGASRWARVVSLALTGLAALTVLAAFARSLLAFGVPLALIGLGVYLVLRDRRFADGGEAPPPTPAT